MSVQQYEKVDIINELVQCVVENVIDDDVSNKIERANNLLVELFIISGGNINNPDRESVLKVLKLLAARQLKKGKDINKISNHIKELTSKLDAATN